METKKSIIWLWIFDAVMAGFVLSFLQLMFGQQAYGTALITVVMLIFIYCVFQVALNLNKYKEARLLSKPRHGVSASQGDKSEAPHTEVRGFKDDD